MSDANLATPAAGDNKPPLAEVLIEEAKPFRERADALIASVNASRIDSPETAAQVTTLGTMLRDLKDRVEGARKEQARPFDEGKATVQRIFKAELIDVIDEAMTTARKMIDDWHRKLADDAAAEQRRRDDEAAKARADAEEAERKKQEASAAGDTGAAIRAEMEEMQARDRAASLETDNSAIRPDATIRSHAGSAASTTTRTAEIADLPKVLSWLSRNQRSALIEAIQPLVARLSRAKVVIPGVEIREEQSTRFRR